MPLKLFVYKYVHGILQILLKLMERVLESQKETARLIVAVSLARLMFSRNGQNNT